MKQHSLHVTPCAPRYLDVFNNKGNRRAPAAQKQQASQAEQASSRARTPVRGREELKQVGGLEEMVLTMHVPYRGCAQFVTCMVW